MGRRPKTQNIEGNCDICGDPYESFFNCSDYPFVNGKNYNEICLYCGHVPKPLTAIADENPEEIIHIGGTFTQELYTAQEMVEDGFEETKAINSIKYVAKLLKFPTPKIKELIYIAPKKKISKRKTKKTIPKIPSLNK